MPDLTWQVKVLRELLAEAEKRMNEQAKADEPSFQLWSPCIAKTRCGETVPVFRSFRQSNGDTHYYEIGAKVFRVKRNGRYYRTHETSSDIVDVVRLLSEKEIIDFQVHVIKPNLD